jgi:hypothetical protein
LVAELVYGELLAPAADPVDPAHLITELRQHMARLRPVSAARHASPATFVHNDLEKCTHVFLRRDTTRRALEPPIQRLLVRGSPVTVSIDKVKPAYILNGADHIQSESRRSPSRSTTCHTNYTLRPPHSFPSPFQHLSTHLRGRGVMLEPPTSQTDNSHRVAEAADIYTSQLATWVSGHPHKRYPISVHNCSSIANWSACRLAANV